MAILRLKIEPAAVDMMLTAIALKDTGQIQAAGNFAFSALGRVLAKNLPEESGPTTPTNFSLRLGEVRREKNLPVELEEEILDLWTQLKYFLGPKALALPSYRVRRLREGVKLIQSILEEHAGVQLEEILSEMTVVDRERLQAAYSVDLMPSPDEEVPWEGFEEEDFDNLFELRKALETAGLRLQRKLESEKIKLNVPRLSAADYTSAYVTLRFPANPLGAPGEEAGFRVMATNDHLVCGLYFGMNSRAARERYYALLPKGRFEEPLRLMARQGGELLDIFWFYNLENRFPLSEYVLDPRPGEAAFRQRLAAGAAQLEKPPYSSDVLLPARVISREEAMAGGMRVLDAIWEHYRPTAQIVELLKSEK